jgi:leader peptidase (prepilin peptidase) / N-methyltransferase
MQINPIFLPSIAAIFGLLIGSFLNVVVYRLPKMLEFRWMREAKLILEQSHIEQEQFNLALPCSKCPCCGHHIRWYENIPILSYLCLRGKCSSCKIKISARYPIVEFVTAILFYFCFAHYGSTPVLATLLCFFSASLLVLMLIDYDTMLLPDDITLPLLWLGLIGAVTGHSLAANLGDAVLGAIIGYGVLWLIYWVFKLITGKEGMGYGDFKLLAALGAWFGYPVLLPIILISSIVGLVAAIFLKMTGSLQKSGHIPFGPFLAGAGFIVLFVGSSRVLSFIFG